MLDRGVQEEHHHRSDHGALEIIRTILLMSLIRMFDCYRDVPMTFKMVSTMFTKFNFNIYTDGSLLNLYKEGRISEDTALIYCVNYENMSKRLAL